MQHCHTAYRQNLETLITRLTQHFNQASESVFEIVMNQIVSYIQTHATGFRNEDLPVFDRLRMHLFLIRGYEEQHSHNHKVLEQWNVFMEQLSKTELPFLARKLDMSAESLAQNLERIDAISSEELCLLLPFCQQYLKRLSIPEMEGEESDYLLTTLLTTAISLRQLDLKGASNLTNIGLKAVGSTQTELEKLAFPSCCEVDEGVSYIAIHCPNLISLDFSFCSLGQIAIDAIARACGNLQILNLSQCLTVDDHTLESLAAGCPALIDLDLTSCRKITFQGIQKLVEKPLQRLILWSCDICDIAVNVLCKKPSMLHTLNLWGNTKLTEQIMVELGKSEMSKLRTLYLNASPQIPQNRFASLQSVNPSLKIVC